MLQPRFKQYTQLGRKPKEKKPLVGPGFVRGVIVILVLIIIAIVGYYASKKVAVHKSMSGAYEPPSSLDAIDDYSSARMNLHEAHADILTTCMAWYAIMQDTSAGSLDELESAGCLPFQISNHHDEPLVVLDQEADPSTVDDSFYFMITRGSGNESNLVSYTTEEFGNLHGETWLETGCESLPVKPESHTDLFSQFLPSDPGFEEEYACFLAQVWESAIKGYIRLYQRKPVNFDELTAGLGLSVNPGNQWPFYGEEEGEDIELDVRSEAGLIDGDIVYWSVKLNDGETRGQARFWDIFTPFDDPETPVNIVTTESTSPVVNPIEIEGTRNVIISLEILRQRQLELIRPPEEESEN